MQKLKILYFLVLSIIIKCTLSQIDEGQKKIKDINVLIPLVFDNVASRKISYLLTAFNGCYEWKSSKPEFLKANNLKD